MSLRKAAEMALKYFEDAHGLEDTEVEIKDALRQALAKPKMKELTAHDRYQERQRIAAEQHIKRTRTHEHISRTS